MLKLSVLGISLGMAALLSASEPGDLSQTIGHREEFNATAIVNNNLGAGAGRVIMRVTRWSTEAERGLLTRTLLKDGSRELLDVLQDQKSVGTIRTPDSLGYDLRYAHRNPAKTVAGASCWRPIGRSVSGRRAISRERSTTRSR